MFNFDNQGFLTNAEGLRVQGFGIDPSTQLSNGQLGDIQISTSIAAPNATEVIEMSVNLDANATGLGASGTFDPGSPNTTSNFRTVVTVYDSLGMEHPATVFFTKLTSPANTWEVNVALPTADTTIAPASPTDDFVVQPPANLTLTFDSAGNLTSPSTATNFTFEFAGGGAPSQVVGLSFGNLAAGASTVDPTTQFAADSTTNAFVQDGFAPGTLQGLVVDREGFVTGQFSNGENINLAQLGLANFPSVEELVSVGNNRLAESRASGQALVGGPETGTFGSIRSSTIEQSNVDLATQFVKLIINQRAFQANTRTISVTNELLATLNALGQ
jgi:flagellar hook protein FlgE